MSVESHWLKQWKGLRLQCRLNPHEYWRAQRCSLAMTSHWKPPAQKLSVDQKDLFGFIDSTHSLQSRTHVLRTSNKVVNPYCGTKYVNYVNEALVNYQSSGLQVPNMCEGADLTSGQFANIARLSPCVLFHSTPQVL